MRGWGVGGGCPNHISKQYQIAMLPFAGGGVTELPRTGQWGEGEGPTESFDVCDFAAPSDQDFGDDCEGPAGLRMNEENII